MAAEDAAVVVTLRANLKDYEAALKSAVRATEKAAAASEKALSNIGKRSNFRVIQNDTAQAGRSLQAMQANAKNLGFQFNDLATSIASGGGALRAFAQQGGQISQIFSGLSLKQIGATIGTALIDPFVLLPIAIGVATTALTAFFSSGADGAKDAEKALKALKEQRDLIRDVAKACGDALPALKAFNDYLEAQENSAKQMGALEAATKRAGDALKDALQASGTEGIDKVLGLFKDLEKGIPAVIAQWEEFKKHVADGTVTVEEAKAMAVLLNKTLNELPIQSGGKLASGFLKALDPINQLIAQLQNLNKELKTTTETTDDLINNAVKLPSIGPAVTSGAGVFNPSQTQIEFEKSLGDAAGAIDSFVENVIQAESGGKAGAKNPKSTATGAGQFIESTWLSVFKQHFAAEAAGMSDAAILALRTDVETNRRMIRAYASDNAKLLINAGQEVNEASLQLAHFLGAGGAIKILQAAPGTRAADVLPANVVAANRSILGGGATREDVLAYANRRAAATQTRKEEKQQFTDWMADSKQRIEQMQRENDIRADATGTVNEQNAAIEKQKFIQEGLDAAKAQGITITAEVTAQIERQAEAMANLGLKAANAVTAQQEFVKKQADQAQALAQLSQQIAGLAQSAIGGLINDLRNGVDAGDAFNNMLNRILDSLIQMSLQSLFSPAGGGGIGGWLASLLGGAPVAHGGGTVSALAGAGHRKVSPMVFAGAQRYASGGMVGLRAGEVPIIAHRGEIIVPNARRLAGNAAGGGSQTNINNQLGPVSIDMAGTGLVAAGPDQAKQMGENIRKIIAGEMVRESRPGGLLRRVPG